MSSQKPESDLTELGRRMGVEWDRRVAHDYRYWMSDGVESDSAMWDAGARDFDILVAGLDRAALASQTSLELGCGVGRLLRSAARTFSRAVGVDVSVEAIEKARVLLADVPNIDLVIGNGIDLSILPDESIDFAYTFAAMSSMPVAVISSYLAELSRVLKRGSILRLQVYLGRQQQTCQEDTIAIRSFTPDRFVAALRTAGIETEQLSELVLPFEISNREEGLVAHIVSARKTGRSLGAQEVHRVLGDETKKSTVGHWEGSRTEYLMAVARAKQHLEAGQAPEALQSLEFAITCYAEADRDVRELAEELRRMTAAAEPAPLPARAESASVAPPEQDASGWLSNSGCSAAFYEQNLRVVRDRFPDVAAALEQTRVTGAIEVHVSASGAKTLSYQGLPLSHRDKPERSGHSWAERAIRSADMEHKEAAAVIGFADGYHIRGLLELNAKELHVVEPCTEVLKAALAIGDYRQVLLRLASLSITGEGLRRSLARVTPELTALLVHPQTQVLHPEAISDIRRVFRAEQGFGQLRPSFAVVGPMWGGSLPLAAYTASALARMKQRVTYYDLSRFYDGFIGLGDMLKDKERKAGVENRYVEMLSQIVLEGVSERPVDIVICLAQAPLSPRVLTELRERGIITVMWFVEDCRRFLTWQQTARYFDYMFLIQKDEFPRLVEQAGAGRALYLPVGCDPEIHRPVAVTEEEKRRFGSQLSFVGAGYNNRRYMFALLAQHDFKIWGTEWPNCMPFTKLVQEQGRRISVEDYVKIFNSSTINLNLHSSSERDGVEPDGDFINPRTFELASIGAFQLVDNRRYLSENFIPGQELATFSGEREMIDLCDYYLAHPEERAAIAAAGRQRALKEHTYEQRLKQMLEYIYADRFEQLSARVKSSPWNKTLAAAGQTNGELHRRLFAAYERGDEPTLDSLVGDIKTGHGALNETEQLLLFMHHIRSQISHVRKLRKED